MIPEIGNFALMVALCMAMVQAIFPLIGAAKGIPGWMAVARKAAWAQWIFIVVAFSILTHAFVSNDFSVAYVAHNSNSAMPLAYRISAVWGAHEGSLLLWALILSCWTVAVAIFSRSLPRDAVARVIGVMGLISIGFLLFLILTSNPFERLIPAAAEGRDLNPLLQDPGLVIHPPMLYMGYVGFSVAFSFAIAALLGGRLDAAWARWSRPWTIIAWVFLTLGVALGSWWAYYELGWGGWWFWDPVENASFMPWLVGTALMHSLAVTEKRGSFRSWTVLLAISAFSLSLLGTFLVRSGVLTSVHAFATDPARGAYILAFLGIVIGGSLALFAWRAPKVSGGGDFQLVSRESLLLANNVLLVVAASSILLGTIYPLILDALDLDKISVGFPYFNSVFIPLMTPLVLLMGLGPIARWKGNDVYQLLRTVRTAFFGSIILGTILSLAFLDGASPMVFLGLALAFWVILTTLQNFWHRVALKKGLWNAFATIPRSFYGMNLAHLGVAVFIIGITLTSAYNIEKDLRMGPGDSYEMSGYTFHFGGTTEVPGPNYTAQEGRVEVTKEGATVAILRPQKRLYHAQRNTMTEAGIDAGLFRDLYVALGEPLGRGEWSVRLYYKPFVRWIWLGAIFMAIGGVFAASDSRYRLARRRKNQAINAGLASSSVSSR